MATDATGTPTSRGIPTYNVDVDSPSGLGFNAAMTAIDSLIGSVLVEGAYGTSLPVSPSDGQVFTLVDSLTTPSYHWQFRFNAGSTSLYKWEFLGGPDLYAVIATIDAATATTYADFPAPGPSLVVPRAGVYQTSLGFSAANAGNAGGGSAQAAVWSNAAAAVLGLAPIVGITAVTGQYGTGTITNAPLTFATAGDQIRLRYLITNGLSTNFTNRWLKLAPIKVI